MNLLIVLLAVVIAGTSTQNNTKMEQKAIQAVIRDYAAAVDDQNVEVAEQFLDQQFRVVLPKYGNSSVTAILTRDQYTGMMRTGKVGGNKRNVDFLLTDVHEVAAVVKVKLESDKNVFTNYYNLVKTGEQWLIINDMPQIVQKLNK